MSTLPQPETIYVDLGTERLHVQRFRAERPRAAVLLVHGAVENGRIFYSTSGKGLAPYLAAQGMDVFAADLRGRGQSTPRVSRESRWGQTETITEDIPALARMVSRESAGLPQHWVAHSWGGVLLLAAWGRQAETLPRVHSLVCFGSKRCVRVWNPERVLKIDLVWNRLARWLTARHGYLPARDWRIGSDDESAGSHAQSAAWVRPGPWTDPQDGFDYAAALARQTLPPSLFLAAVQDACLGHPQDVRRLMQEAGAPDRALLLLGKAHGAQRDYNHVDMLTHPLAVQDHFPKVAQFIHRHSPAPESP